MNALRRVPGPEQLLHSFMPSSTLREVPSIKSARKSSLLEWG